jgi:anti-sigma factor RsiW
MTDHSTSGKADDLDTFRDNLDRWGADLSRWPDTEAAETESLLETSDAARRELAQAIALEEMLTSLPRVRAPAALKRKLATPAVNAPDDTLARLFDWFAISFWRPVLSASLPLVIGFTLGFLQAGDPADIQADQNSLLAFSSILDDYNEEYSDDFQ